jgi:hypothetical protein
MTYALALQTAPDGPWRNDRVKFINDNDAKTCGRLLSHTFSCVVVKRGRQVIARFNRPPAADASRCLH